MDKKHGKSSWKVYFEGDFWVHHSRDHAGKEIRINKEFDWVGHHWIVPAAYSCGKGLVIDFCMQVSVERIRSFMEKWNLSLETDSYENFTKEQQMQMEIENPLCLDFRPCIELNGNTLRMSHSCGLSFNPCLPKRRFHEPETKEVMEYYGLDESFGWIIGRSAFSWAGSRRPEIKKLFLTMEQLSGQIPGPHFKIHKPGDTFTFVHSVSGMKYTLTVQEIKQQSISEKGFDSERWLYPRHYVEMSYTMSPEPDDSITIFDCHEGDKPMEILSDEDSLDPVSKGVRSVAVIGGTDGPVAILPGVARRGKLHRAYSALHFENIQEDVEWRIVFHVKQFGAEAFLLI